MKYGMTIVPILLGLVLSFWLGSSADVASAEPALAPDSPAWMCRMKLATYKCVIIKCKKDDKTEVDRPHCDNGTLPKCTEHQGPDCVWTCDAGT